MKLRAHFFLLLMTCLLIVASDANAAEDNYDDPNQIGDYFSLGILYFSDSQPYTGVENENRFLPAVGLQSDRVLAFGPLVQYRALGNPSGFQLSLVGEFKFYDGYLASDSPALAGMDEREGTIYLGAKVSYNISLLSLKFSHVRDVLGKHRGAISEFSMGTSLPFSTLLGKVFGTDVLPFSLLTPSFGLKHYNASYINYYFGVKDSEVTASRPAYVTNGGFSTIARISLWVRLSHNISWSNAYSVEYFPDEIKNSPIVDQATKRSFFTSLSYLFFL